jgi:5-formyltetrahydrofolate cyclo-ligase
MQPEARSPVVEPDLILVPLVAIDRAGNRLGRGKGHYDAALSRLRRGGARLIGLGWSMQLLNEDIPADPWDVPLDAFASPDGLHWFGR